MTHKKDSFPSPAISGKPLRYLMIAAPFLVGGYHEWTSCLISLYLIGCLWLYHRMGVPISLPKNLAFLASCVIAAGYAISVLWAIDKGMAFWGFIKFLPLPLFCLALHPLPPEERPAPERFLPITGVCMTALSF